MKRFTIVLPALLASAFLFSASCEQSGSAGVPAKKPALKAAAATTPAAAAPAPKKEPAPAPVAAKTAPAAKAGDTLVVVARITEIAGKFAPNDLYNYVYIMKYRVISVVKGAYKGQDILVGHYNPLIPRSRIKDAMEKYVSGTVEKFDVGAKQQLTLITPIDKVWKDAVEDEYPDSELDKYFALKADITR